MQYVRLLLAVLLGLVAVPANADGDETKPASIRALLGQTAPEDPFCTPDGGAQPIADLANDRGVILIFPAANATEADLVPLAPAIERGSKWSQTSAYVVLPARPVGGAENVVIDCNGRVRRVFGLAKYPETQTKHTLLYIAPERVIRRVEVSAPDQPIDLIFARVNQWHEGKLVYRNYCGRCHGPDGAATSYPNIIRLDGIGARLNEQEIIDNTRATAFVNIDALPREDREALAVFVAALPPQD